MNKKAVDLVTIIAGYAISGVSLAFGTIKLCKFMKANKEVEETPEECTDDESVE